MRGTHKRVHTEAYMTRESRGRAPRSLGGWTAQGTPAWCQPPGINQSTPEGRLQLREGSRSLTAPTFTFRLRAPHPPHAAHQSKHGVKHDRERGGERAMYGVGHWSLYNHDERQVEKGERTLSLSAAVVLGRCTGLSGPRGVSNWQKNAHLLCRGRAGVGHGRGH